MGLLAGMRFARCRKENQRLRATVLKLKEALVKKRKHNTKASCSTKRRRCGLIRSHETSFAIDELCSATLRAEEGGAVAKNLSIAFSNSLRVLDVAEQLHVSTQRVRKGRVATAASGFTLTLAGFII
jgi:hypothetical protein